MAFDLIIFDCDGVLVDSEVISCHAHADTLTRHGYPITPEQVLQRFLGVSDREARLMIETEIGRELPDDFEAEVKAATCNSMKTSGRSPTSPKRSVRSPCRDASHRAAHRRRFVTA